MHTCIKRKIAAAMITTIDGNWLWDLKDKQSFTTKSLKKDATEAPPLELSCNGTLTWLIPLESDKASDKLKSFFTCDLSKCSTVLSCVSGWTWPFGVKLVALCPAAKEMKYEGSTHDSYTCLNSVLLISGTYHLNKFTFSFQVLLLQQFMCLKEMFA